MKVLEVTVSKSMRIGDVKTSVLAQLGISGVSQKDLVVCNQKNGKITDFFEDKTSTNEID